MPVFAEAYLEKLRRRWSTRDERDWPLVARIALLDYRSDDRDWIEASVDQMHPADQPKMIQNLQTEKQFITAYNELVVGQLFANLGLNPRYEAEFETANGKRTPDWYLGGSTPIVCDVFTAGLVQARDADETSVREIEARLSEIKAAYTIGLQVENGGDIDPRGRRDITTGATQWLAAQPQQGDTLRIGRALLEVMLVGGDRVDVITMEPMHIVETPPKLAENFDEKTKRYAPLGLPLVAAAVKHHRAEIHIEDVEDTLLGKLVYVSRETASGRIVEGEERVPNGIFSSRPDLSAAIWIEPHHLPEPVIKVWVNPSANRPVPTDLLKRLTTATL